MKLQKVKLIAFNLSLIAFFRKAYITSTIYASMKSRLLLFKVKTIAFLLFWIFIANSAQAQKVSTNKAPNLYWVFGGGGISTQGGSVGFGASRQFRQHIVSGRFVRNYDFNGDKTQNWDAGVLYGRSYKTQHAMISLGAGVAYVGPSSSAGTVGLPLESQIFWTPTDYFGIGVYGFGNLNTKSSFGGALLGIQIGRVTAANVKY